MQHLFEVNVFAYAPHPDGKSFLINDIDDSEAPTINVIGNAYQAIEAMRVRP